MKSKHRNFWSFFWRVGAGFLAFWLAVMIVFTMLLGWQKAQSMLYNIEEHKEYFLNEQMDVVLRDENKLQEDGTPIPAKEIRADLRKQAFLSDMRNIPDEEPPAVRITETAITDVNGKVLQSNRYWIRATETGDWNDANIYIDMTGQTAEAIELALQSTVIGGDIVPPELTMVVWIDGDIAYPKQLILQPRRDTGTEWVADGEPTVLECRYDEEQMAGLRVAELNWCGMTTPGPVDYPIAELAKSLVSERRLALREWVEAGKEGGEDRTVCTPWLVQIYTREVQYCPYAVEHIVTVVYAAEAYPLKACLPILVPVWGFSFVLAVLFSAILAFALLRVWRKQERVEQARRDTTAALAHELKTPLSVLSATAELLSDDMAKDKRAHYLDVIRQQAQRMDGSVRRMLELSRLEAGAKALRRERFSLSALARERLDAAVPPDSPLHTSVVVDGPDEAEADRALLARALDALLENAVQHTPPDGSITVRIEKGVCAVVNTGEAIPPTALPHLWEAYFQADPARTGQGDGLGLSIAKTVFDLHGYAYGAENKPVGPRFWFRFGKA